jgi:hypothetical protein
MTDSGQVSNQPVRVNARTRRSFLISTALMAAIACMLDLAFALGSGWDGWWLATWPVGMLVLWLIGLGTATEWTAAGGELRRRGWLSRPGREPTAVMALGPQVEIVHDSRTRWRIQPFGPSIWTRGREAAPLAAALESAGVRVVDWRRDWARRHRLLDALGVLFQFGTGVGGLAVVLVIATGQQVPMPLYLPFMASIWLYLGFDYLPWMIRRRTPQGV